MNKLKIFLLLITALFSALLIAADKTDDINITNSLWIDNLNKGDFQQLVKLYADEVVVMPPSSEILTDREAIEKYWESLRSIGVEKYKYWTIDLRIEGDKAYQTALWEASRTVEGNAMIFEGNMSNILERQSDGSWKIALQSWN